MRIIHDSHIKIECPKCCAVLGVECGDIQCDDSGHRLPYTCNCLACGETIPVKKIDIPNRWLVKLGEM